MVWIYILNFCWWIHCVLQLYEKFWISKTRFELSTFSMTRSVIICLCHCGHIKNHSAYTFLFSLYMVPYCVSAFYEQFQEAGTSMDQCMIGTNSGSLRICSIVKMMPISIPKIAQQYFKEAANDMIDLLMKENLDFEKFNSTVRTNERCSELTEDIWSAHTVPTPSYL